MSYIDKIKSICAQLEANSPSNDIYKQRFNIYVSVKSEINNNHKHIEAREWVKELAQVLGVSNQTLYRSVAAYKAWMQNKQPLPYAQYPYNNIIQLKQQKVQHHGINRNPNDSSSGN